MVGMIRERSMSRGRRRGVGIVAGFCLIAVACSGGGNDDSSSSTIVESTTGSPAVAATTEKTPSLVTLAGDPFEEALLAELAVTDVGPLPDGFTPAGAGVDVTVIDGSVGEPLRLSIPGTPPPADAVAVLLHRNGAGMWEANPAVYAEDQYVAEVSSFSPYLPGFLNPVEWFDSVSDWLTGRTDPPADCETDPYGWVADQAAGPADGSFHACIRANPSPETGTERVEVKIKSNRSMAMWITIPDHPRDYLWVEGAPDWDSYGIAITELDGGTSKRVLLGPGRTMTVGYTRPIGAGPELVFSSYQNNTTQVASLAQQYLGDLGYLGLLAAMAVCVEGANTGEGFEALALEAAVECLPKTAEMLITGGVSDGAKALSSLLDTRYASIVAQGRMQLSVGASDGIEQLVNNASATGRAATALKAAGNALLAANLLADATSMLSDAVLAFSPGLNTYTVFLIGTNAAPTSEQPLNPTDVAGGLRSVSVPSLCGNQAGTLIEGSLPEDLLVADDGADLPPFVMMLDDPAPLVADVDGDGSSEVIAVALCAYPSYSYPIGYQSLLIYDESLAFLGGVELEAINSYPTAIYTDDDGAVIVDLTVCGEFTVCVPEGTLTRVLARNAAGYELNDTATQTVQAAQCISLESMYIGMTGERDQVALLQATLANMGHDPGEIDGYFGRNTFIALANSQMVYNDGTSGGNGVFLDEGMAMEPVFDRLGISCS